jgi:hypothetical protein
MGDYVALRGLGQSYHNYAKRIITFTKQTHNSKLYKYLGHCNTEITSNIYVHIFKEYKAKMAESIEHDLL